VVIIHEVYPDGAAAKDGRLRPGDQLAEVNGEDFRSITHIKALGVLRQTPAKVRIIIILDITPPNITTPHRSMASCTAILMRAILYIYTMNNTSTYIVSSAKYNSFKSGAQEICTHLPRCSGCNCCCVFEKKKNRFYILHLFKR